MLSKARIDLVSNLYKLRDLGLERDRLAQFEFLVRQNLCEDEAGLRAVNRRQGVLRALEAQNTERRAQRNSLVSTQKELESELAVIIEEVTKSRAYVEDAGQHRHERLMEARREKQDELSAVEERLFAKCAEIEELDQHTRRVIQTQRSACRATLREATDQRDSAKAPLRGMTDYLRQQLELVGRLHGELDAQMMEEECALRDVHRLTRAASASAIEENRLAVLPATQGKSDIEAVRAKCAALGESVEEARKARFVDRWRRLREEERVARRELERLERAGAMLPPAATDGGVMTDWNALIVEAEGRVRVARDKWLATLERAMRKWMEWGRAQQQRMQTQMKVVACSAAALEEEMFMECLVCSGYKVLATIEFRNRKIREGKEALRKLKAEQEDVANDINDCLAWLESLQAELAQAA